MKSRPALLVALLLSGGCARIEAPSGGPEDTAPPEIASVQPEPGPGIPETDRIVISWSERVEESSAEVFVYPGGGFRTSISGRLMEIDLDEPLGRRTLVVHVPPGISDLHGNRTEAPIEMAFSGSDSLPHGRMDVLVRRQGGGTISERTLLELYDPATGRLLRRTSADSASRAVAAWLEPGEYRVLCYEDPDFTLDWSRDTEAGAETLAVVGFPPLEIEMTMTVVDTIGPVVSSVEQTDGNHIKVSFNEQVSLPPDCGGCFSISDGSEAPVTAFGAWSPGGREPRTVIVATSPLPSGVLRLMVRDICDMVGNRTPLDSLEFDSSDSLPSDSLRITSRLPEPGALSAPASGPFEFAFSDWVDLDSLEARFSMVRVSDGEAIEGRLERRDGRSFAFLPEHELLGEEQHRIDLAAGLRGASGDTLGALSWSFISAWGTEPGGISGVITGGSDLVLEVSPAGGSGSSYIFHIPSEGPYIVRPVAAGRYTVAAYADRNGNGRWDGRGESYGAGAGVVLVRPGVVTAGVDMQVLP
ncbi:Ig-like domain-containing protein [Candidatus Fermentibacteria bacterium]|nr:Ig-like domain-containing protein [Candidatus Fermentibacteria bacterium]